jgi:hypothetical protein
MRHLRAALVHQTPLHQIRFGAVLLLLLGTIAPSTMAEEGGRVNLFGRHYSVIAGASMFVPDDAVTRSIYGRRAFSPVISLWNFGTPRGLGLSYDLGGQRSREAGSNAYSLRGGVGPRFLFAPAQADFAPYVTVRGDAYVMRLGSGDWRTKPGANVEVGASIVRHLVVSARYDAVAKVDGVSLSGFSGRVTMKAF